MKKRIEWIDFAKGITILLVIIGHTVPVNNNIIRSTIFSFHMPLFFILSGLTYRYSTSYSEFFKKLKRSFFHLIIPVICLWFLTLIIDLINNVSGFHSFSEFAKFLFIKILVLLYSSGNPTIVQGWIDVPGIGITWFLVALFVSRGIYDLIQLSIKNKLIRLTVVGILCILGIVIERFISLPFSLNIALSVLPFFVVGEYLKNFSFKQNAVRKLLISFAIWASTFLITELITKSYLELAAHRYPLFPLCYITAVAGTIFISEICLIISDKFTISKSISYLGRFSLYMLCIHSMDWLWRNIWDVHNPPYIYIYILEEILLRCAEDILLFVMIMVFKYVLKRCYAKNKEEQKWN